MIRGGVILLFFCLHHFAIDACNLCGCNYPQYIYGSSWLRQKNYIGFSWFRSNYNSYPSSLVGSPEIKHQELIELISTINLNKRVSITGRTGYYTFSVKEENDTKEYSGIRDAQILSTIVILDTLIGNIYHQFNLSGGIEFTPSTLLGENKTSNEEEGLSTYNSKTLDWILNSSYLIRYKSVGLNVIASYKINPKNHDNYKIGNELLFNVNLFTTRKVFGKEINFFGGWVYTKNQRDESNGYFREKTGGKVHFGQIGLSAFFKSLNIQTNLSLPLYQKLNNSTSKMSEQFSVSLNYIF